MTFETIPVGSSEDFVIKVRDSADTDETIESATIWGGGADAFEVTTTFPLYVPAGQEVPIGVRFAPAFVATFDAQLVLQTAKMGPSPVSLTGASVAAR